MVLAPGAHQKELQIDVHRLAEQDGRSGGDLWRVNQVKRRVIIGAALLGLGGVHTHLVLLCEALRQQDVEVVIFATGSEWNSQMVIGVRNTGVKFQLPPPLIRASRKASALYSRFHWPFVIPGTAQSLYCISAGRSQLLLHQLKPSGAVSVNHEIVEPPGMESPAGRCAGTLDVTVANSRKVAEQMKACWPKKPIRSIPFLTSNATMPRPLHRRRIGPRDLLRVVYLGRLVEQKRPDRLVKRWPVLSALSELAPARLDVHGYDPTGKMLKELRTFTAQSGCSEKIAIHGEYSLSQLPEILENADLVVLPSLWEGLPLVLVEAMLRGVPFVATAAGGTEELGQSNPNVLVTNTNWEDFENGILQMAGRIRAGQIDPLQLHKFAEARYGFDAVSRQWLDCLLAPQTFFNLHG